MNNPMSLENKTVIVTGAASGIGKETSRLINSLGGNLLLLDIDEAGLNLAKYFTSRQGHDSEQQGSIVFISSVYGVVGSAANVAYATSKAAIIGMTKALAIEFAGKDIRVNCVAPGFIKTNMADGVNAMFDAAYAERIEAMHPLGWGEAIDIANAISFLLSDASKWTTGAVFNIDGGFTAQ